MLHYGSFRQITDDISDARVYGGIHFRFDQDAGARLGRAVGRAVYKNDLRAVHENDRGGLNDELENDSAFVLCGPVIVRSMLPEGEAAQISVPKLCRQLAITRQCAH
jgi:hypothetical protein